MKILTFLFIILNGIVLSSQNHLIVGKWYNFDSPDNFIEFDSSGFYNIYNNGSGYFFSMNELKFDLCRSNEADSIFDLNVVGLFKGKLHLNENYIIIQGYKKGLGIEDHIDEVGLFMKEGIESKVIDFSGIPKIIVDVPTNYLGQIFIAFNQSNGDEFKADSLKNEYLVVEKNGLLSTLLIENPLRFVAKKEVFRSIKSHEIYPVLYNGFSRRLLSESPSPETICILSQGFNQYPRQMINNKFGKKIEGNVGCYIIDTYENLLKLER